MNTSFSYLSFLSSGCHRFFPTEKRSGNHGCRSVFAQHNLLRASVFNTGISHKQVFWLMHQRLASGLLSLPMAGFRPKMQPPHIQRRYRPGFAPGSLFSANPKREGGTCVSDFDIVYQFPLRLSTKLHIRRFTPGRRFLLTEPPAPRYNGFTSSHFAFRDRMYATAA